VPKPVRFDEAYGCVADRADTQDDPVSIGKISKRLDEHLRMMARRIQVEVTSQQFGKRLEVAAQHACDQAGGDEREYALRKLDQGHCT
jgi:hypothetical protein